MARNVCPDCTGIIYTIMVKEDYNKVFVSIGDGKYEWKKEIIQHRALCPKCWHMFTTKELREMEVI